MKKPNCFFTCADLFLANQKHFFTKSTSFFHGYIVVTSIIKLIHSLHRNVEKMAGFLKYVCNLVPSASFRYESSSEESFLRTQGYHAPVKMRILRAGENYLMSKALLKAILSCNEKPVFEKLN